MRSWRTAAGEQRIRTDTGERAGRTERKGERDADGGQVTWVRTSDDHHEWPTVSGLSDAAFRLHYSAREYACRALSDGYVPLDQPARLVRLRRPKVTVLELIEARLWHEANRPCAECTAERERAKAIAPGQEGFLIHGFFPDQQPRHKVLAERAAARRRMERIRGGSSGEQGGERSGEQQGERSPDVRSPRTPGTSDSYESVGYGGRERSGHVRANRKANGRGLRPIADVAERLELDLSTRVPAYPHDRVDAVADDMSRYGSASRSTSGGQP